MLYGPQSGPLRNINKFIYESKYNFKFKHKVNKLLKKCLKIELYN